jgi:hypothetical protein
MEWPNSPKIKNVWTDVAILYTNTISSMIEKYMHEASLDFIGLGSVFYLKILRMYVKLFKRFLV